MRNQTLKRLKHTAKLESLIAQEADYEQIHRRRDEENKR